MKTQIGTTPYWLVFGKHCHLPFKIEHKAYWDLRTCKFEIAELCSNRLMHLNALDELRNKWYTKSLMYKDKTKKFHDVRLRETKEFEAYQKVLLFNSRMKLFHGELKTMWYRTFVVKEVFPHGAIELIKDDGTTFKGNGNWVKHYEERMPRE